MGQSGEPGGLRLTQGEVGMPLTQARSAGERCDGCVMDLCYICHIAVMDKSIDTCEKNVETIGEWFASSVEECRS